MKLPHRRQFLHLAAGAAGLAAALMLARAGWNVTILEGRNRVGGRIYTLADSALNVPLELGAEFIHGRPQVTWNLLREYIRELEKLFSNFGVRFQGDEKVPVRVRCRIFTKCRRV